MLTITGRSIGSKRPLFSDWSIPLTPEWGDGGSGELTLRGLITRLVLVEVGAFRARAEARRLDRVLSQAQIDQGERAGKIAPEGRAGGGNVSDGEAVDAALQAFEDGLYLVVIDEQEFRELDEIVRLNPDSHIVFVRLIFLAGA